jgi:Predicted signal transduction protein with a C-terminal ATPase domain
LVDKGGDDMLTRKSITYNYLKAFILLIVLPVMIISFVINKLYINTLQKNASDQIIKAMEQIAIGLENEGKRAALLAATIAYDDETLDLASQWQHSRDPNLKFTLTKQIDSKLNYLFNYTNDIESVVFFFRGGGYYYYKNPPSQEETAIKHLAGYQNALKNPEQVVLSCSLGSFYYSLNSHYVLSAWIKPGRLSGFPNRVEEVYVGFHSDVFDSIYLRSQPNRTGAIIITDNEGKVISADDKGFLHQNIRRFSYLKPALLDENQSYTALVNHQKMFITTFTIQKTNWKIMNLIRYRVLTRDIEKIWHCLVAVLILIILLFLVFTVFFFRSMIIPVNKLIKQMQLVEQGNFNANIEIKGNHEIYQLGQSFNKMVYEINHLITERNLKERARSKAELEALKSQINPHFIANTLNSIRLMAMIAKVDSIKNMTGAFMKLLAASFSKDDALTSVRMEMEYLQNYTYIMKVRYGDKFDVTFDISQDILETFILKLILQPILENAILHGVSELAEKGIIQITGRRFQDDLLFEIKDNGVGISPEQVKKLLTEDCRNPKGFSSIGIMNVDKRIKLNYGNNYGLTIESVPGEFTKVKIVLPLILENGKGENEDV